MLKKVFATRFTTGGKTPTEAPGQTKSNVAQVPYSLLQDGKPGDVLRVTRQQRRTALLVTPFMAEDPSKAARMVRYALRATRDSLNKGEAPLASHLFFSEVLNIRNPIERDIGLQSQLNWMKACDVVVVYLDFGITPAMQVAINNAILRHRKIEYRTIGAVA